MCEANNQLYNLIDILIYTYKPHAMLTHKGSNDE